MWKRLARTFLTPSESTLKDYFKRSPKQTVCHIGIKKVKLSQNFTAVPRNKTQLDFGFYGFTEI